MSTFPAAAAVAKKLSALYGRRPWCTGIGVAVDGDGYCVVVRVRDRYEAAEVPEEMDGVRVLLERRPPAVALGAA